MITPSKPRFAPSKHLSVENILATPVTDQHQAAFEQPSGETPRRKSAEKKPCPCGNEVLPGMRICGSCQGKAQRLRAWAPKLRDGLEVRNVG